MVDQINPMQQGVVSQPMQQAQQSDLRVIFSGAAQYSDKIFSSADIPNGVARITFCESIQGTNESEFRTAVILTKNGITNLRQLFEDLEAKFKAGALEGHTLQ